METKPWNGQAVRHASSRLRIHKIGVYGDDWAFFQARRSAQPTTRHVRLRLLGKNPFGDRGFDYERDVAKMKARKEMKESLNAPKRHDPAQEPKQAENHALRSLSPQSHEPKAVERHVARIETRHLRHEASKPRDIPHAAHKAEDWYFRKLEPLYNTRRVIVPGKGIHLRRLWGQDDAPNEMAREYQQLPLRRVSQLEDKSQRDHKETIRAQESVDKDRLRVENLPPETPISTDGRADTATDGLRGTTAPEPGWQASDGHRPEADQARGATDPRVGFESWNEMPPRVLKAITRRYELFASERKPLFTPRPPIAPEAPSIPVPSQAKGLPVAAAEIGPAESLQRLFAEDPVLLKAQSLAGRLPFSMQPPSRLEMHSEPRFRLVPSWRATVRNMPKSPQPSEVKSKSLESHMSELQIKDKNKLQTEQAQEGLVQVSGSTTIKPEATDLEQSKATDDMQLKAPEDRLRVDMQDESTSGLVEPTQPPAPDNRSIFEKLFEGQEGIQGPDYGKLYSKLKTAEKTAKRGEPSAVDRQNEPEMHPQDGVDPGHGLSIFRQLFPEQAKSETARSEQEPPRAKHELLQPPEDYAMVSLRNEVRNWMPGEAQDLASLPKPGDYGSHSTVVVISGTSPSLMDTDFYRIAPEGQHVEGWAGGLVKVIQARDAISFEPLGQYYLMFHSRPSALAYVNEVWRLHELSRKMLHAPADSGREVAKGPLDQAPASPQPFLTDEERAAVRSFTLCSPHITPYISVRMWNTRLVRKLAAKSNIADILPTLRPEGATPARVLLKLTSPDRQHGEGQGGLTADELWLTLRDDGRERSAPWVLANLSEGIMPVKPKFLSERHKKITVKAEPVPVPLELGDDDDIVDDDGSGPVAGPPPPHHKDNNGDAGVDKNERFRRFVLTFTQPAIARRFVRCWHKRVVYDALLDRSVVVDAVAIM